MSTYAVKVYLTADDIYNKLSDEDKKRFNKAIITDVTRGIDMGVDITCILVNDCPVELSEYSNKPCRTKYVDDANVIPYKEQ